MKSTLVFGTALALNSLSFADPILKFWYTEKSGQYARLYETTADMNAQNAIATWNKGQGVQDKPTYAGVNEISYNNNDVFIRTTNLPFHTMGPWYLDIQKQDLFGNYPANLAAIFRFPRTPSIAATKTRTSAGAIGYFADGVAMFDSTDTFSYSNREGEDSGPGSGFNGDGIWNRDAFVNESVTFDNANAHQAGAQHHYHANPPGLRHLLGDSVDYDPTTNVYTENFNGNHSPIIGWCRDGYPIYGPYGYSDALDANSTVRRMISGYQKRDGSNGSTDLETAGRTTLPAWCIRNGRTQIATASEHGPDTDDIVEFDSFSQVDELAEIGRYLEDYAYKGDLGLTQGTDFDLNEYNVRFCITPDFPAGTWAYFTCIESDGTPAFPYSISNYYFGNPTGGSTNSIPAGVTIHFQGGPEAHAGIKITDIDPSDGDVTLTWTGVEGGFYNIERSGTLNNDWGNLETDLKADSVDPIDTPDPGRTNNDDRYFYRIVQTSVDDFDDSGFDHNVPIFIDNSILTVTDVSPNSGNGGPPGGAQTVNVSFKINGGLHPDESGVTSATIDATSPGPVSATQVTQFADSYTATFTLQAQPGTYDITVNFFNGDTATGTGVFTINPPN
ncbi:MAG: YHYH protein [Verrucomicrobiota bacterium]